MNTFSARALISPPAIDPSVSVPCSAVFDSFEPVTLPFVQDIVGRLKPPWENVPPRLLKEVFIRLLVPVNFKHAVVQPQTWAGFYCFGKRKA